MSYFGSNYENRALPLQEKANKLVPSFENAPSQEQLTKQGLIPLEKIGELSEILENIAIKTGIPRADFNLVKSRLFLNPTLAITDPHQLGGFHTEHKYIQFNPYVLEDPNAEFLIAHVFFHEYQHMIGFDDEAIVEMMTIKKMMEAYGRVGIQSGYVNIVEELQGLIGEKSYDELYDLMNRSNSERLDTFLKEMIMKSVFDSYFPGLLENIKVSEIMLSAQRKWKYLLELFPRLVNQVSGKDYFEKATMSWFEYNKTGIEDAIAEELLFNQERSLQLINKIINKGPDYINDFIADPEYQYIFEYAERNLLNFSQILLSSFMQAENQREM
ncbi:MAG: hypothetical protein ABIM99_03885 [Candidatus Dojkabacteria bacterium]